MNFDNNPIDVIYVLKAVALGTFMMFIAAVVAFIILSLGIVT